jgi:cerevisin
LWTLYRNDATWGLSRISRKQKLNGTADPLALTFPYVHDANAGEGVDIYIVDTGVRTTHSEFGGRASWGISFVGETTDNDGHGTHCAGTAAGSRFGVAKVRHVGFFCVFRGFRQVLMKAFLIESQCNLGSGPRPEW